MKKSLIFLGTGGSVGVPVIGCLCDVCCSDSPFNQRLRPSVLIQHVGRNFLIDAGPDFRLQALRYGITMLEGVLLTHAHHDHIAGIDDLRPIYYRRESPLPILLSAETAREIKHRYYYIFQSDKESFIPRLSLQLLPDQQVGQVVFENLLIQYVTYEQGGMPVNGYRIGELAYVSDIRHFEPHILDTLKGVRYLIISALRRSPSPLHFSVDEAIEFGAQIQAEQVWLTHLSHELDYVQTNAYLPAHVRLAYDGLTIDFD